MTHDDDYDDKCPHVTMTHDEKTMRSQKDGTMRTRKEGTTRTWKEGTTTSPHDENDMTTNSDEVEHPFLLPL